MNDTKSDSIYLADAAVLDVMLEQIEYLVGHGGGCKPNCPDCRRLEQLKTCLLQPFSDKSPARTMVA